MFSCLARRYLVEMRLNADHDSLLYAGVLQIRSRLLLHNNQTLFTIYRHLSWRSLKKFKKRQDGRTPFGRLLQGRVVDVELTGRLRDGRAMGGRLLQEASEWGSLAGDGRRRRRIDNAATKSVPSRLMSSWSTNR